MAETSDKTIARGPRGVLERQYTQPQLAHRKDFLAAVRYAREAQRQEIYRLAADSAGNSAYNMAMADWFHLPEVHELDLSAWRGQAGDMIRVRASDDVRVQAVTLQFCDAVGRLLEAGAAREGNAQRWEYTTSNAMTGLVIVTATATDLPGNRTALRREKRVSG